MKYSNSNLLKSRVDNLATLSEGSTTGDAELIGIRTGYDGTNYPSAGEAVQTQISNVYNKIDNLLKYDHYENKKTVFLLSGLVPNNSIIYFKPLSISQCDNNDISNITDLVLFGVYTVNVYDGYDQLCTAEFGELCKVKTTRDYHHLTISSHSIQAYVTFDILKIPNQEFTVFNNIDTMENDISNLNQDLNLIESQVNNTISMISDINMDIPSLDNKVIMNEISLSSKKYIDCNFINNSDQSTGSLLSTTRRWFMNHLFNVGDIISNISFYNHNATSTVNIEIWEKIDNQLIKKLVKRISTSERKVYTISFNYVINKPSYVAFITDKPTIPFQSDADAYYFGASTYVDIDSTNIPISDVGFMFGLFKPSINISYKTIDETNILIGEGMRYESIQDAIENITDDSINKPYTLFLLPSATPYTRFSMIRKLNESYKWNNIQPRYISIIGLNKNNCVIESGTGEYDSPPAEILTNGIIKNITFKMTKESPLDIPKKGGYSVHIDCRTLDDIGYNMTFENCNFFSDTGPAVGIGMHTNANLAFINCYFESTSLASYIPNENYFNLTTYGCVFAHSSQLSDASNQKLTFRNCVGVCKDGDRSLWVAKAGDFSNETGDFTLTLINNIFYNNKINANGYIISPDINLNPISYGNNITL